MFLALVEPPAQRRVQWRQVLDRDAVNSVACQDHYKLFLCDVAEVIINIERDVQLLLVA